MLLFTFVTTWFLSIVAVWLLVVAFGSFLYALIDVNRGNQPFCTVWWDYFYHVAFFRP